MTKTSSHWLLRFARDAKRTDQFFGQKDQLRLLSLGLLGEAGSILTELKKNRREGAVYVAWEAKTREELGDFLWYFVRVCDNVNPRLIREFSRQRVLHRTPAEGGQVGALLEFGNLVGQFLSAANGSPARRQREMEGLLGRVWISLGEVARLAGITLKQAAGQNRKKTADRWGPGRGKLPLFDEGFPDEECLPRSLEVDFLQRKHKGAPVVILRSRGINLGDRLTDNIAEGDEYRFHDVFHFGFAAYLGWSPVTRGLLRCKRKSKPRIDENEDGGRATVIEEAISAAVFSRAKRLDYYRDTPALDYDLLKQIQELVRGYEVQSVPLWQWERAILSSYAVFRQLKEHSGGRVMVSLEKRRIEYLGPMR